MPPDAPVDAPLILVVDDGAVNRMIVQAILARRGYRCHVATNGCEAVEASRRETYAAVLMDCLMPEMDGYQASTIIRQDERAGEQAGRRRHLPIIAVTAVAVWGAREQCIASGMDDYLSKPVDPERVLAVLERWLAGAGDGAAWASEQAGEPATSQNPLIDLAALETIRELDPDDGEGLVAGVVGDFATDAAPHFLRMRIAASVGDTCTVLGEFHYLAGCAATVGATHLERLARSLMVPGEVDAETRAPGLAAAIDRLEAEFQRACEALASIVAERNTPAH
jgi:CheY-like chemotaxis protein